MASLAVLLVMAGQMAIRIDSCYGECDPANRDKGSWKMDFVPLPHEIACDRTFVVSFAIDWLAENRPGYNWAGSACVRIVGQET